MKGFKFVSKDNISKLPEDSGVYAFWNKKTLFYIGKAINIKERVKNHFLQPHSFWEQTLLRPSGFEGQIGFNKTDSEIEALILEAKLIKKYRPKYNIVWKDDKNYFYVAITKGNFPKVFITHQIKNKKSQIDFIGPFIDGNSLKQTLKILRKVFPYRSCNNLPKKPCLWYQLDRCLAPCLFQSGLGKQIKGSSRKISKESMQNTKNLKKILIGKKSLVLENLKKEMKEAATNRNFETAATIRDQIRSFEKVMAHSRIFEPASFIETKLPPEWRFKKIEAYDVSNIQGQEATGSMVVFINGSPDKSQYRKFKIRISGKPNDIAMLKEILFRRLKHLEWSYPDLILIDGGKAQLNIALETLKPVASNLKPKVMAIAKKKDELYMEGKQKPILLKKMPREVFNLILQLRDEAHRFAIAYHKKLRERGLLPS